MDKHTNEPEEYESVECQSEVSVNDFDMPVTQSIYSQPMYIQVVAPSQPFQQQPAQSQSEKEKEQSKPKGKNIVGIIGFVLSLVAILLFWTTTFDILIWLAGLVCSTIGVCKRPRGFAIAGLTISILVVLIVVIAMIMFASLFYTLIYTIIENISY